MMILRFQALLFLLLYSNFIFGQRSKNNNLVLLKDTICFVRTNYNYIDSAHIENFIWRNGKFIERISMNRKQNLQMSNLLEVYTDKAKYLLFKDRKGRVIEEGFFQGIWDGYFCNGLYKSYHKNGKIFVIGNYVSWYRDGKWLVHNELGIIKQELFYKDKQLINIINY